MNDDTNETPTEHQRNTNEQPKPYNGWLNYETWNVAQFLTTTPENYAVCVWHKERGNYYADVVLEFHRNGVTTTTDGVELWSAKLDTDALDAMIYEMP